MKQQQQRHRRPWPNAASLSWRTIRKQLLQPGYAASHCNLREKHISTTCVRLFHGDFKIVLGFFIDVYKSRDTFGQFKHSHAHDIEMKVPSCE